MSQDQPPPPGWTPPSTPPPPGGGSPGPVGPGGPGQPPAAAQPGPTPGWGSWAPQQPPYPGQAGAPGYPGYPGYPVPPAPPVHKPGAIPLRPLTLGDFFDAAFRIVRYNPQATVGAAVLVSAVAMVVPIITALVTGSTGSLQFDANGDSLTNGQIAGLLVTGGSLLVGTQLQSIGLLFVSGMIAHVTSAAAVGRKLTMGQAWAATHGKRWRLFAMALLLGLVVLGAVAVLAAILVIGIFAFHASVVAVVLVGLVLGGLLFVGYVWFWVRVRALAVPTLMLEPVGIFTALGRSVALTREQFWRLFGILLLMGLVVGVAANIVQLPFSLVGNAFLTSSSDTGYGIVMYVVLLAAGSVLSSAFLQPFQAAVNALLYVDQRIRKEAYDVELLGRAGLLTG